MVDITSKFSALVQAQPYRAPQVPRDREVNPYQVTTVHLSDEVSALSDQVRLFRLDHARASMTSVTRSGAAISSGAERLKKKFEELERAVKVTSEATKSARNVTSQGKQHLERIILTLEQRLGAIAKEFRETLEKRAKSLADRQERQKNLFGEGVNYRYEKATPPPHSPSPGAYSQPHRPYPSAEPIASSSAASGVRHRGPLLAPTPTFSPAFDHGEFGYESGVPQQQQTLVRKRDKLEITKSRLHDVEKVERTIGELSQMFVRVAGIVKEHEEIINDIEANVDDTAAHTNQAQLELMKLFQFVSADRALIVKLLAVTLIAGLIIIYFWT